eukprot:gene7415-7479_t
MLYRAQDKTGKPFGTSRIGLAESTDAIHFKTLPAPVFYPKPDKYKKYEWQGGCEDPRVVQDVQGTYYMTYTAYDGVNARLLIATSADLIHWIKHGSVFAKAYNGKYLNKWSKSGSIVSTYKNGTPVATRINGKYWMYWGDQEIWIATSDDLINWTPVEMNAGEHAPVPLRGQAKNMPALKIALATRNGKFDSDLSLAEGTYTVAEVLFDRHNPAKIIHRLDKWFLKPEQPYELTGQVNQVCFAEGLTRFNNKWYLYYGTADSKIAVAFCSNVQNSLDF